MKKSFEYSTDPLDEWHDIVDNNDRIIGKAQRINFLKDRSLMRRSCHIWLFNSKGELWIQQRSKTKDLEPLYWSYTIGGFVKSGARSKKAILEEAKRELKEELVIETKISLVKVLPLKNLKIGGIVAYLYIGKYDGAFRLDSKEVKAVRAINLDELLKLYKKKKIKLVEPFMYELEYCLKNRNKFLV